jgi:hypothetical protein
MSLTLSMNEVDALCRKAARGAGMSWGLAEEAGKTARFLAERNLPGPERLAAWLAHANFADSLKGFDAAGTEWRPHGAALDPVAAGASLADHAAMLPFDNGILLHDVAEPLLLIPFLRSLAMTRGKPARLDADGYAAAITPEGELFLSGPVPAIARKIRISTAAGNMPPAHRGAALAWAIAPEAFEVLDRLAFLTYAPHTETSRLSGAGAGLSDND